MKTVTVYVSTKKNDEDFINDIVAQVMTDYPDYSKDAVRTEVAEKRFSDSNNGTFENVDFS